MTRHCRLPKPWPPAPGEADALRARRRTLTASPWAGLLTAANKPPERRAP